MKSFIQFLEESYLYEAEVTQGQGGSPTTGQAKVTQSSVTPGGRVRSPKEQQVWAQTNQKDLEAKAKAAARQPSGAAANPNLQFKKTTVPSPSIAGQTTPKALPPGQQGGALAKTTPSTPAPTPEIKPVTVTDVTPGPKKLPAGKPPSGSKPSVLPTSPTRQAIQNTKTATDLAKTATDTLGKGGNLSKWGGRALAGAGAALDAADEYKAQRARGRTRGSSAAMGVTKAAGGLAGAEAGAAGGAALGGAIGSIVPGAGTAIGAGIGGVVGGIGGYMAGSGLAGKASEVVAGATGKEKAAMATANRQRQSGGALKGIGGPTSFDTKKNTMTTGVGSQRKTVQLAKTSVVTGPGGKQDTGYLAYKGGKAVYKRAADPSTLAKTSSNPLERIGRSLFAGAYKQSDAAAAAKKLSAARQSDTVRNRALGVKFKPGG